jgi:putative ABC transport system permease protein
VLWSDLAPDQAIAAVRAQIADVPLFFRSGEAFRKQAQRVIGRFSMLLMVPLMIVGSIGLIGLINLLVGNVAARHRDLAILRASGATTANVLAVVSLSAAMVALIGTVAGIGLGLCWAVVIRDAIAYFLGWRMAFYVDWMLMCKLTVGAMGAASVASAVPVVMTLQRKLPTSP